MVLALGVTRIVPSAWCGHGASAWYEGDAKLQMSMADDLMAFEARDDRNVASTSVNRFAGEWALVTHQMTALGLAQMCLAHPEETSRYAREVTHAALKSFRAEMRTFGTEAWHGEDALQALESPNGHAYLAYSALALGMARLLDPAFPPDIAKQHDALVAAYERRLLAQPTGLIETYPGEAFPTDVSAVAAAIAVHGRVTGVDHAAVLRHWADAVANVQIDKSTGLVLQRMGLDASAHDSPRGSGTALAAYFAGFADRHVAELLARGLFANEASFWGFDAIREYGPGTWGTGDVDSGPVLFGVSVSATGFALAPAHALGRRTSFERIFRTTDLFGMPATALGRTRFGTGGPIGNAVLFAMITSGPELAP
jgi:hypothetical protein